MKATQTASSVVAVAAFALCSGGCSRSVQMYVRNDCPFAVSVHERTEWRYGSRMNDRDRVMPQGVFLITEMGRAESAHLQVVDSEGKFLSRVTVNAAAVNAAYWDHDEIFVEVKPGQSSVVPREIRTRECFK